MKVFWTDAALEDRSNILDHIAADNVRAAIALDELFGLAAARLAEFPYLGKPGQVPGTRELLPHESYRLVYEADASSDAVWVLALVHTARRWPPLR